MDRSAADKRDLDTAWLLGMLLVVMAALVAFAGWHGSQVDRAEKRRQIEPSAAESPPFDTVDVCDLEAVECAP